MTRGASDFPTLALAALIVGSGIWIADQFDSRAAWLLVFLVLLMLAFSYPTFASEIADLLSAATPNQQTTSPATATLATPVPQQELLIGPTGPVMT